MKSDETLTVRRIRIDLKDFDLSRLPEIDRKPATPWVALGKHLCGSGTDYALLACQRAIGLDASSPSASVDDRAPSTTGIADRFTGLFIATCCHHRCNWESYAAKENFVRRGVTEQDFELVSWMTGSLVASILSPSQTCDDQVGHCAIITAPLSPMRKQQRAPSRYACVWKRRLRRTRTRRRSGGSFRRTTESPSE